MYEDRDMTYGELVGLLDRLISLGALEFFEIARNPRLYEKSGNAA